MFHERGNLRQRTRDFARRIARAYRSLPPRDRIAQVWGQQLLRSGSSIGANYREAQRGRSLAKYRARLGDCLREADGSLYWMELLELEGFFRPPDIAPLKAECGELIAIFITLLR